MSEDKPRDDYSYGVFVFRRALLPLIQLWKIPYNLSAVHPERNETCTVVFLLTSLTHTPKLHHSHPNQFHHDLNFADIELQVRKWNLTNSEKKLAIKECVTQIGIRLFHLLHDIGEGFYTENTHIRELILEGQ
jgi:hypothetical protein